MQDSQGFDQISNSTLTKLLEVDSELAGQEGELLSQLESVQEKRKSLKTVISLFTTDTPSAAPIKEAAQTPPDEAEPAGEDLLALPLESRTTATVEPQARSVPDTESNGVKKKVPSSNRRNETTKFTHPPKASKKASQWQQYVREEFRTTSLPEAVALVLRRQADAVLEIPTIVNAICVDEIPKDVKSKARRQVTNILSNGARKNKWYRGQLGYYSMSRAAAQASSS